MMRTPAHAIRMRTYAFAPYSVNAHANSLSAPTRTLSADSQVLRSTPSWNAPRLCVPGVRAPSLRGRLHDADTVMRTPPMYSSMVPAAVAGPVMVTVLVPAVEPPASSWAMPQTSVNGFARLNARNISASCDPGPKKFSAASPLPTKVGINSATVPADKR